VLATPAGRLPELGNVEHVTASNTLAALTAGSEYLSLKKIER
jgi:hypothetical protein